MGNKMRTCSVLSCAAEPACSSAHEEDVEGIAEDGDDEEDGKLADGPWVGRVARVLLGSFRLESVGKVALDPWSSIPVGHALLQ